MKAEVHRNAALMKRQYGGYGCPQCSGPTAVGDSRPANGGIRRRRYCKCGFRFSTYEFQLDEAPQFLASLDRLAAKAERAKAEMETLMAGLRDLIEVTAFMREVEETRDRAIKILTPTPQRNEP